MPDATAARAIARLSSSVRAPSSTPGRMCECRSIMRAESRRDACPDQRRKRLGGLDLQDLELHRAARGRDFNRLALLLADDRLADRRLVRELVLGRVRLGRAD